MVDSNLPSIHLRTYKYILFFCISAQLLIVSPIGNQHRPVTKEQSFQPSVPPSSPHSLRTICHHLTAALVQCQSNQIIAKCYSLLSPGYQQTVLRLFHLRHRHQSFHQYTVGYPFRKIEKGSFAPVGQQCMDAFRPCCHIIRECNQFLHEMQICSLISGSSPTNWQQIQESKWPRTINSC